ncbi:hypothetical protein [Cytobacillus oceanisediminis]|uniref:Uncharacterized protein n=1 Tax=Cytobacillus oceanisediminis TaxID=665099 RepID=A0A562K774_9BACI|nr:hypothetical protein [Cytobacillus oceanisediminis]TWH91226.1 hypothetical protein IQ19_00682 [Cytobacillus oceanisediminis]
MKNAVKILAIVFFVTLTFEKAEASSLWGHPHSIVFKGESKNWFVEHKRFLIGTMVEYETSLTYKGTNQYIKKVRYLTYLITDGASDLAGDFSLKCGSEYKTERIECGGCRYLDKQESLTFILDEYGKFEERIILKRER